MNNTINQAKQKKLILTVIVVAVLALLFLLVLSLRNNGFRLVSVTPENNGSVPSDTAQVSFMFSETLSETDKGSVSVSIEPKIDFIFIYKEDSITLKLSDLRFNNQNTYQITLKDVFSESGKRIKLVETRVTITLTPENQKLLGILPLVMEDFSISLVDNELLRVEGNLDKDIEEADKFLVSYGVTPNIFKILYVNKDEIELF